MDKSITAVIGAVIFAAFVLGLAESIGSLPFFIIVGTVVLLMGIDTFETVRGSRKTENSKKTSK